MSSPTSAPDTKRGALGALARGCAFHPVRTIVVWAVALVAIILSSQAFGGALVNAFSIPGSETQSAVDLLEEKFPERAGDSAQLVFATDEGTLAGEQAHADIDAARAAAAEVPGVTAVGDPYAGQGGGVSEDGTIGFVDVQFDKPAAELDDAVVEQLEDDVRAATADSDLQVEFGGTVMDSVQPESHTSEVLGLLAAMIVLLVVLGSMMAMAVPITTALISVGIGMSLLMLAARFTDFNEVTPILAVMIGLGVGIDYSLFIVTRFRQALADGQSPREAAVTATTTAGRAVLFAGLTVAVSISGLAVVGIPFVTNLGVGAAMTVVGAVITAVTLLPALLSLLGHRIDWGRLPSRTRRHAAPGEASDKPGAFDRWGGFIARHPKALALAALAAVLVLAIPATDQRLGTADAGTNPQDTTTRKAYDLLAEGFGPGFNGPLLVAVDQADDPHAAEALATAIAQDPGVATVVPPLVNKAGDTAQIPVVLTSSPQSEETAETLDRLRTEVIPGALAGSSAAAYVGGATASYEDIASKIGDRMGWFLLYIVGITFLILAMAFRSIVVAAKAAGTTMLSAAAAFGALTAVFEWGWLSNLIGLDVTGPTESFIPMMVLSILFGLSMDYEVFLVSRVREEYVRDGDARAAVRAGVGAIGKVIVAAGIIMGVVFWAFVLSDDRTVKAFGLGLGVAILVDALIVRMVLVPAVMHLLGRHAWYIPRWLDRLLPAITIEPAEHDETPAAAEETAEDGDSDRELVPVG